jgi:hypothetical protein
MPCKPENSQNGLFECSAHLTLHLHATQPNVTTYWLNKCNFLSRFSSHIRKTTAMFEDFEVSFTFASGQSSSEMKNSKEYWRNYADRGKPK